MQKKLTVLILTLLFVTGCEKPPQTTGIITQQTVNPDSQKMEQLKEMAQTDPVAAYDMGLRYLRGDGVEQNSYQAIVAFRTAAEQGDLKAQVTLGKLYTSGMEEMGADLAEAEKWLSIAAARGDKESKKLLKQVQISRKQEQKQKIDYRYDWYYHIPYRLHWRHHTWGIW